jgi:hypothetical protein
VCWLLLAILLFVRFRNRHRAQYTDKTQQDKDTLVPPSEDPNLNGKFGAGFDQDPESSYTPVA